MKLPAKRFDKTLPLPSYEAGAAGFDFVCRQAVTIKPKEIKAVPANLALDIPKGYVLVVASRSSTASRLGLTMANGIGIIDPFYDGDDNEIMLLFYNFTSKSVHVRRGDRIAQGILVRYETVQFDETKKLKPSKRATWSAAKRRTT